MYSNHLHYCCRFHNYFQSSHHWWRLDFSLRETKRTNAVVERRCKWQLVKNAETVAMLEGRLLQHLQTIQGVSLAVTITTKLSTV